jgi:hypothetical protein
MLDMTQGGSPGAMNKTELKQLEREIGELAAQIQAATYRLLELLRRYDEQGAWADGGFKTCAAWLSWYTSIDLGAAREKVRVSRALPALPQTSDALRRGELSYSKVRALTRVATADNEEDLLVTAKHGTTAHVERVVRAYRKADLATENERALRQLADRRLTTRYADDGSLLIEARLPPEEGAKVLAALDATTDLLRKESPEALGSRGKASHSQRQADALVRLADGALAAGLPGRLAADTRQVVLHVDAEVLANPNQDGQCELHSGVHVSAETARRFSCDCRVVTATEGDVCTNEDVRPNPQEKRASRGRAKRVVSGALRRAVLAEQRRCQFPGCHHERFLEAHHIVHWANGGETSKANTCLLCSFHHAFVHEGSYRVARGADGGFDFISPWGSKLDRTPPLWSSGEDGVRRLIEQQEQLQISCDTTARWNGDRFNLHWAVPTSVWRAALPSIKQ